MNGFSYEPNDHVPPQLFLTAAIVCNGRSTLSQPGKHKAKDEPGSGRSFLATQTNFPKELLTDETGKRRAAGKNRPFVPGGEQIISSGMSLV